MNLKGARVLVTGAGGFIGSHLVEGLLKEECSVRAFLRYTSNGRAGWIDSFAHSQKSAIDFFWGDIRDYSRVKAAAKGMDIIFHLAALIGIPYSYFAPESYLETNIWGTYNVLEAARELRTRKVIVTSTSEVYGTAQYVPINELHPRQAQSPYSASKIAADALAESYARSFKLPVVIARPFNTYGPRQSSRAVIPTLITQALGKASRIRIGSLHPRRDFVFVKDTVGAFCAIAESDLPAGLAVNIATGSEISVGELAKHILRETGSHATINGDNERKRPQASEVERLLGDSSRLRNLSGWKPRCSLDQGLARTIAWFALPENRARCRADRYCI
jgi:NAD dependent epimerase/dehydratase